MPKFESEKYVMQYIIRKTRQDIDIRIGLPSSKSISNRLLIMSALSKGGMLVDNLSDSDDSVIMNSLLHSSGVTKDAGNAGTVMRFLTAYYALVPGEVIPHRFRQNERTPCR